jgi:glycerophosphoryl diester phosphodiesterase
MIPQLVHHKAALDGSGLPPNALAAVRACLEAGAEWIEVDICALQQDDFLLVHTHDLAAETDRQGEVNDTTPAQARTLRLRQGSEVSLHAPALLSEVVDLLAAYGGQTRLQLDWKDHAPYASAEPLARLARLISPLGSRMLVSSMADWQLRRLAEAAPQLELGFDIHLYMDYIPEGQVPEPGAYPRNLGVYGYRDDHPLSSQCWGSTADYLAERCKELLLQVPGASTYYLNHVFIARCLADGFDWAQALHARGRRLDAWTLDADNPQAVANARRLANLGCDQITSNTPLAMAALLKEQER